MNGDEITKADTLLNQASEFFTAHPSAKWLLLAWLFGWVIAFIARPFIRMSPLPDRIESFLVVLACMLSSTLVAAGVWDGWSFTFRAIVEGITVTVIIGGTSPFGYLGIAKAICWKWPDAKPHLSLLKDFTAAVDDEPTPTSPPGDPS